MQVYQDIQWAWFVVNYIPSINNTYFTYKITDSSLNLMTLIHNKKHHLVKYFNNPNPNLI